MKSSSLIFLVIVAIWAAYLLQHWVRRREHLATARSVDRFSEAMRVLERRRTLPAPDASASVRMSDGWSDRPAVPLVSVKPQRPSLRAGASVSDESAPRPASAMPEVSPAIPSTSPRPVSGSETSGSAPVRVGSRAFQLAGTLNRQILRAAALVGSATLFLLAVVLTPFGVTPWWSPLLLLAVTAGVVAWLRSGAVKAAHDAGARSEGAEPRRAVRTSETVEDRRPARAPQPAAPAATTARPGAAEVPSEDIFDVNAGEPAEIAAETAPAPAAQVTLEPGQWQPIAVPPPTYTLKARAADRHQPLPAATTPIGASSQSQAPTYADMPVEELPFDGLALDEELEDLPAVHRAG